MERVEFRKKLIEFEVDKTYHLEFEESDYPMVRQEVDHARKVGYKLRFKTKRQSTGTRFCVIVKLKEGNANEFKIRYGL